MKIRNIQITAGRGFNHPREAYANFKFDLTLQAELEEGEDAGAALVALQTQGERAAEQYKEKILADVERAAQIQALAENLAFEKRKAFDSEVSQKRIAEMEERLAALTSTPLLLTDKTIPAGHIDHPDTQEFEA